ncbi:MAG: hypothetical protein ACLSHU_03490 [Oscillospiraceae bacterium]
MINSTSPVVSVISGYVLSALFLPMVLLGLHHGLIPIYAVQLEAMGGVTLFPVLAMAGAESGGGCHCHLYQGQEGEEPADAENHHWRSACRLPGRGRALIYGVTLPMGKPFITAGLGAGFGGAFVMLMHVMSIAWGPSGLVAIPLMKTPIMMLYYFLGLVIAYIMGFIITWFGIKAQDVANV